MKYRLFDPRSSGEARGVSAAQPSGTCGSVIVVAPPALAMLIACLVSDLDVVGFNDLRELDRWRSGELVRSETIRVDVENALREIGCEAERLTPKMRCALEAVCHERVVPSVIQLERMWGSRRSFYRAWAGEMPIPPSSFLRRVRTLRAERLIACGATPKEAAIKTGFGSVDRLRRLIAQRRAERAAADGRMKEAG